MAPIVDNSTAGSSSAAVAAALLKEKHPEFNLPGAASAINVKNLDNFGDDDSIENGNDTMTHHIDTINNNNPMGSSLFMDECGNDTKNNCFIEDAMAHMDLQGNTSLLTSFDFDDIDLLSTASPPPPFQEHFQQQHTTPTTTTTKAINNIQLMIISNDEELARQLQAEEDELARRQREMIFRKKQKSGGGPTIMRKLKKSWLDNLIGEPFPQEMRMNYTKKAAGSSKTKKKGGATTTTTSSSGLMAAIAAKEARAAAAAKKKSPPTFIDHDSGGEGYYQGDYLTNPNNNNKLILPLQRHGQGTMNYKSGHTYTGNFQNNKLHGWGIYHWNNNNNNDNNDDDDRQRGTWKNGLRHGPCIFHHGASHQVEYGYYHEGQVVGEGVRLDADRKTAWKLEDGTMVGMIEIGEAERIVEERFGCFPIPPPVDVVVARVRVKTEESVFVGGGGFGSVDEREDVFEEEEV